MESAKNVRWIIPFPFKKFGMVRVKDKYTRTRMDIVDWPTTNYHLDIPKTVNGQIQIWKVHKSFPRNPES